MAAAVCTECGKSLADRKEGSVTCGATCRSARSRRLRRQRKRMTQAATEAHTYQDPEQRSLALAAHDKQPEVVKEVMREELRPVVREAITEDTLRALHELVALTPRAVQCIAEDLHGDDLTIRQRAYTLLTKYTIGHQAIVRPAEETAGQKLEVHFALPRPGHDVGGLGDTEAPAVELEVTELRTCDMCEVSKPITDFIAGSQRCAECYEQQREYARQLMKDRAG